MKERTIKRKTILGVLSMSLLILGPQAISPAMAGLMEHFSQLPTGTVRVIISLPLITLVLFTLLTGPLEKRFDKKKIALSGIAIYTIAGLCSIFSVSFGMLVVCRLILGAGLGLFASYSVAFLSMLLEGEERSRCIGFQSTACNIGSLVLTAAAGVLAAVQWNATFLIYAVGAIPFVLVLFFVPSFPPMDTQTKGEAGKAHASGWAKGLVLITIGNVLFFLVFFLVFSDFSVLILRSGLGSIADGGVGLSLLSVAALVVSLFYKQVSCGLKRFTAPVGVAAAALGFSLIGSAGTLTVANLGAIVLGLGFGLIMPHCYARAAQAVDEHRQPLAAATQTFATNLASFASSYVLNLILHLVGREVPEKVIFICAGIVMMLYFFGLMMMSSIVRREKRILRTRR